MATLTGFSMNTMNTLPEPVKKYLMYLLTIKGSSKLTVKEYLFDLRLFCKFLKQYKNNGDCDNLDEVAVTELDMNFFVDVSKEDVFAFLFFASEHRENAGASRARKLSAIKGFFKYLQKQMNIITENPAENIDSPNLKQSLPKYLSLEESLLLLTTIEEDEWNVNRERDYCIITLFLNCGMRLSELVGINLTDISRDFTSIKILGKRNKERVVFLNESCRKALAEYLVIREKIINESLEAKLKTEKALFISKRNRRICNSTVQKMVVAYFDKSGLAEKNYSTHKLRHTAATLMYQHGNVDTRVLQEILGHEHINTTQIYTHVANAQLIAAMDKSPLAKVKAEGNLECSDT